MDILSDVSVSGNLTAKQLNANSLNFVKNNNEDLTIKVGNSCIITFDSDGYDFIAYNAKFYSCLIAGCIDAGRIDTTEIYVDSLNLTSFMGNGKAIIVDGKRVIDFNCGGNIINYGLNINGGLDVNSGCGGLRVCGSCLSFKSQNGYYPVFIGLTEFNDSTMHIRADASGFCFNGHMNIDGHMNISGDLCVTDGSIFASRISLTNKHLVSTMTKSLTVPANCSKFHIITAADDFVNPLPYLATMSNGDNEYYKNVNVDYLFNMCNLIGIITPSGESRSMTFTILQQM